ncbi:hypothetical protein ACWDZ6_07995 [Streptomyces sp. NPDC002926]
MPTPTTSLLDGSAPVGVKLLGLVGRPAPVWQPGHRQKHALADNQP